jgi:hypothetical protein
MSNMSYCRFQNTLGDLEDCYEALAEMDDPGADLSPDEYMAFRKLVKLCENIAGDYAS